MKRAQGIKLRWEKEKQKDSENSKIAPLQYLIELEYKKYRHLCFYCHEQAEPIGKAYSGYC